MSWDQQQIAAIDGSMLTLRVYAPPAATHACVILPSAMGVAQQFYVRFAAWLADQGYLVITFDYRGVGLSAPASLRGCNVNIFDWANDCASVIAFAKQQKSQVPLCWLGHSLGGQLIGLIRNREQIDRVVTVATGSGYWLENSWQTRRYVWWLWFIAAPLATSIAGYFPGKRLRKVGDLPRGVMMQWRRWCLNREYVVGAEGSAVRATYASVKTPMLAMSFTDDEMMSEQSIRSLHALYTTAPVEFRRIAPGDIGAQRIGHFGFFRPQFAESLWPLIPQWLAASTRGTTA